MKLHTIVTLLFIFCMNTVIAQNEITKDDYHRAVGYMYANYNNKKVFNLHINTNWFPDSTGMWYVERSLDTKKYLKVTFPDLIRSELFDSKKLASALSETLEEEIVATAISISKIEIKDSSELIIAVSGRRFILNTDDYTLSPAPDEESNPMKELISPNNEWLAYAKDYNLYIRSSETQEVKQLSTTGEKGYAYGSRVGWADIIEGENGERPTHLDVNWSEDSEWLATSICDVRTAEKMYLLDWSIDSLYRPKLLSYYRGSPGDTTMVYMDPVFFNVKSGKEVRPKLPRTTHINTVGVRWSETPGKVYLFHQTRGYQKIDIYLFDLATEKMDIIYTESSTTNIDNFIYDVVEKSNRMFFLSEKSGWRQLYSLDLEAKNEIAITNGEYYINDVVKIDDKNEEILFLASGKEKGRNPYYQHLYSISFDGTGLKLLSLEDRNHSVRISPDGNYFVDNISTVNIPTKTVLRKRSNGEQLMVMGTADVSGLEGWTPPEIFTAIARDGKTTIYGVLWKPTNFDSTQSYPVIDRSYTGPHTQVFPREFRRSIGVQSTAELGFIVIAVDGLGSSGRSKAFHDYSYKNLGGNLEDHVGAIRQLGRRHSWIDTSRVGIYGHSAGGYDAGRAVLAYPEFYKVAVASSADHDHRMEKAWWPEMYMGWPVDSAYHLQSNITMAGNLKGKLLITHGGIDDNVNPSATFKLAEALIKADKQFDMLILPSQRHGYQGQHQKYFTKTRWNYFVKHLRGVEPVWEFNWE